MHHQWIPTQSQQIQSITLLIEIITLVNQLMEIRMLSIQSLLNKSKSSIILSMLEKILLFLEQEMSIMMLWLIKSVVDLDQHQPPEFLRCPIQIDLISLLLSCINEMTRSLTLPFLWLLKHLAGTILISSP